MEIVKIVDQPSRKVRFKDISEKNCSSLDLEAILHTTLEIRHHRGPLTIVVSCVTEHPPYRPHPHKLASGHVLQEHGACIFPLPNSQRNVTFNDLSIHMVSKRDFIHSLELRRAVQLEYLKTRSPDTSVLRDYDSDCVRLCFQVQLHCEYRKLDLPPVVSNPIRNKKSDNLIISWVSHKTGPVHGGQRMVLHCENLLQDVKVLFFHEENGWESEPTDLRVYKQEALVVTTPAYKTSECSPQDILEPLNIKIQLIHVFSGRISEPISFQLLPAENHELVIGCTSKRKRIEFEETHSEELVATNFQFISLNQSNVINYEKSISPMPIIQPKALYSQGINNFANNYTQAGSWPLPIMLNNNSIVRPQISYPQRMLNYTNVALLAQLCQAHPNKCITDQPQTCHYQQINTYENNNMVARSRPLLLERPVNVQPLISNYKQTNGCVNSTQLSRDCLVPSVVQLHNSNYQDMDTYNNVQTESSQSFTEEPKIIQSLTFNCKKMNVDNTVQSELLELSAEELDSIQPSMFNCQEVNTDNTIPSEFLELTREEPENIRPLTYNCVDMDNIIQSKSQSSTKKSVNNKLQTSNCADTSTNILREKSLEHTTSDTTEQHYIIQPTQDRRTVNHENQQQEERKSTDSYSFDEISDWILDYYDELEQRSASEYTRTNAVQIIPEPETHFITLDPTELEHQNTASASESTEQNHYLSFLPDTTPKNKEAVNINNDLILNRNQISSTPGIDHKELTTEDKISNISRSLVNCKPKNSFHVDNILNMK